MFNKRFFLTCIVLFIFALAWNTLLHLVILAQTNSLVQHLHRPDLSDKMWLSLLLTAGIVFLFVLGFQLFARSSPSMRQGALYGFIFALLAGLLVDLNQYILYPIPAKVVVLWFIGGLVEFTLYGIIAGMILPKIKQNI